MKKSTKKTLIRLGVGVAAVASAVGVVMLVGRCSNSKTHDASAFTHGLKVIGDAVCGLVGKEGSMYAGATVVAAAPFAMSEVADVVAEALLDNDVVNVAQNTTPPTSTRKEIIVPTNDGEVVLAISGPLKIDCGQYMFDDDEDQKATA